MAENNELVNVTFLSRLPNPEKLKILKLCGNNIRGDLTPFSRFINLEELDLGISDKFPHQFIKKNGNKEIHGSLKPLEELTSLKKLDISNTNIDCGLEYLHESVRNVYCDWQKSQSRCQII